MFCNVTPCGLIEVYQRFLGTYCRHLQGRRISDVSSSRTESCTLLASVEAPPGLFPGVGGGGWQPENLLTDLFLSRLKQFLPST
jgi:hypothetical protein